MNAAAIIWLIIMVGFLVVEAACPIHLVSVWFSVGALVAALVGQFGGSIGWQIATFFVVSASLLAVLWRYVKAFLNPKVTKTNVDSVIGTEGYVTAAVDNLNATGQVKLGGMHWTARSSDGKPIAEGTLIRVDRVEGVKVFVTEVKEEISV